MTQPSPLTRLLEIMAALRTPVTGCPWDLEQTFASIAPYTIEEAFEVADAIERGDLANLKDELGDLLLQVVYHSRMAEEQGAFAFDDVAAGVVRKMIRRHQHVFGTPEERAAGAAPGFWERLKAEEKAEKAAERAALVEGADPSSPSPRMRGEGWGEGQPFAPESNAEHRPAVAPHPNPLPVRPAGRRREGMPSLLDDTPLALPALTRAVKLQNKAARVGFDWPSLTPVFDKMREELAELEAEVARPHAPSGRLPEGEADGASKNPIQEEFGDLLFVMANVARHLDVDPEAALRAANAKFTRRFQHIELRLSEQGSSPAQSTLAEMDALWDEAKSQERGR